jgi:Icc-related predicted phosphoesterase
MIIDCIADLHGHYPKLEGGDLLIVAGDWTKSDGMEELEYFEEEWLSNQNYKKIILISGNHDNISYQCGWKGRGKIEYLCDSGTEFEGLKIWGSPWTKRFPGMNPRCMAFTVDTDEELAEKWALIPQDIDILVTHSPPYDILDEVFNRSRGWKENCGSQSLLKRVMEIKPKLHVFGHIHESYGNFHLKSSKFHDKDILFVNASHVNERYEPVNKPIRVIL